MSFLFSLHQTNSPIQGANHIHYALNSTFVSQMAQAIRLMVSTAVQKLRMQQYKNDIIFTIKHQSS